ncbi:MAG: type I restriction-modification system subunit M [Proteobacteria bacterium]|nr:type I restriction-modification system subunit M [Pseudomonadota bacterium]MBU4470199.1 type I restriction-modification system subunit M [Pseudomonadota bacterium]MCG2752615.1 type I restriction-modification system subunit M [Desulfobacteraceae bacterium]
MAGNNELEKTLWAAADKLRSNMDAAEYKHIVLGLIFLKYISDAFSDLHERLKAGKGEFEGANPEDADEYLAYNIFFVPEKARWQYLQDRAKQPGIGKWLDEAMDAIEKINPSLKGVLPKIYADPELNKQRLGELIDLIGTIGFNQTGHQAKDLLGRVYEYFLGQFADAEGKKGGQFYTPASIVKLLVAMLEPYQGRVYDGCCGSGGMFVQSERFVEEHQGNIKDLSIYGQESNPTTLRLAKMNLAIRGIDAKIEMGDTFLADKHKDLKADFILANPPFNVSDWSGEHLREDHRWKYGVPPLGNANYAWLQHFAHKLSPTGTAGVVLANGSMNSNSGGEGEIRKNMIEAGLIDCMVALPAQLFYNTMIPACLWFLARNKTNGKFRNRFAEILFIDTRKIGSMINRRNKEFSDDDIALISDTYHAWRSARANDHSPQPYEDKPGFCKAATLEEVRKNNYVLMPGRYVGAEAEEDDGIPFDEKMKALTAKLAEQFEKGIELEKIIRENLKGIGYEL